MEWLLGLGVLLGVPGYFVLQPLALLRWDGGWRWAAAAPLLLSAPATAFSLYALSQDSNLWPITLAIAAFLGSAYLIVLWGVRSLM